MVVGVMPEQTKEEMLESVPESKGIVLELIVKDGYREKGIGTSLIGKIEGFFKQNGCSVAGISVFFPNKNAYRLYKKLGYLDREIWMIKNIR